MRTETKSGWSSLNVVAALSVMFGRYYWFLQKFPNSNRQLIDNEVYFIDLLRGVRLVQNVVVVMQRNLFFWRDL
jgi:hypothetical protein